MEDSNPEDLPKVNEISTEELHPSVVEPPSEAHSMSILSESSLAKDWLLPEEDAAWAYL